MTKMKLLLGWSITVAAAPLLLGCPAEHSNVCESDADCDKCSRCFNGSCNVQLNRLNSCGRCGPESLCPHGGDGEVRDAGDTDLTSVDTAVADAPWFDSAGSDAAWDDAAVADTAAQDTAVVDAGAHDAAGVDTSVSDAAHVDTARVDSAVADGSVPPRVEKRKGGIHLTAPD
jgi:hypothetical protein